jgi:hypothetical protein
MVMKICCEPGDSEISLFCAERRRSLVLKVRGAKSCDWLQNRQSTDCFLRHYQNTFFLENPMAEFHISNLSKGNMDD